MGYESARNIIVKNVNFRTVLGFLISTVLLLLTFYNSGLGIQSMALKGESWLYFGGGVTAFFLALWFQSIRAKLVWLNHSLRFKDIKTLESLILGNFYNCLLPGNLGDGVRAWYFSRKNRQPFINSLAAVVTEKWIDAQLFVLLCFILFVVKSPSKNYIFFSIQTTALVVIVLSVIYAIMLKNRSVERKIWLTIFSFKKLGMLLFKLYYHTTRQIRGLRQQKLIGFYLLSGFGVLFSNLAQFFFLLKATGVAEPISGMYTALLVAVTMMIIMFIPSAPSNVGVLHYGLYSVLILSANQYGIIPTQIDLQSYALFGVYLHLSYFVPEVLMGIIYAVRERSLLFG